jgi:hypothetical protein
MPKKKKKMRWPQATTAVDAEKLEKKVQLGTVQKKDLALNRNPAVTLPPGPPNRRSNSPTAATVVITHHAAARAVQASSAAAPRR